MYFGAHHPKPGFKIRVLKNGTFIKSFAKTLLFLLVINNVQGQVSGTIFNDYNANGVKENTATYNENGTPGVVVNAFNPAGSPLTVSYTGGGSSTNNTGGYTVTGGTLGQIRLEFILPDGFTFATNGAVGGTSVMFPTTATQNLAVNVPTEFCQPNPPVVVSCYEPGNSVYLPVGNTNKALVTIPYNSTGPTPGTVTGIADFNEVGPVWGMAYQQTKKRIFSTSLLKRHSGFGPLGPGGVYVTDYNTAPGSLVSSFNLQGVSPANGGPAIDFGTVDRTTAIPTGDFTLPNNNSDDSRDIDAFGKIGKMSFGDADISPDGQKLWTINLFQRAIISVDVSNTASYPGTVNQYLFSSFSGVPLCTNGQLRPWAITMYKNKGYVGCVCSGENGGTDSNLRAYILSFDPQNPTAFTNEIDFGLNYTRENGVDFPSFGLVQGATWHRWADTWAQTGFTTTPPSEVVYAQPLVSGIDFDDNGNMIVAIMDRFGHQMGFATHLPLSGNTSQVSGDAAGDLLKICNVGGSWVMEGGAGCAEFDTGSTSALTNDGPSGTGEFFYSDHFNDTGQNPLYNHNETSMGAAKVLSGTGEVMSVNYDPVDGNGFAFDLGFLWFSTTNGSRTDQYRLVESGASQTKGNGLGDFVMVCNPAPIEIGNRVWVDANANGVQDAGEVPIQGVIIQLFADFNEDGIPDNGTPIATTTTDANGTWYFNDSNVPDGDPFTAGNQLGLQLGQGYVVQVSSTQYNNTGSGVLNNYYLTTSNVGGAGQPDVRDSDGVNVGGLVQIPLIIGGMGENNHTYDIGFVACNVTADAGPDVTANCTTPTVTLTAIGGGTYLWSNAATTASITVSPIVSTTYTVTVTDTNGCSDSDEVLVTVDQTPPVANAGADVTVNCTTPSTTLTATGGGTYVWSNGATTASTNVSPIISTTYTVTVTGSNGCAATDEVLVAVDQTPPMADAGADVTVTCTVPSTTLTATGGGTYLWSNGATTASTTVNPTFTTTYTVTVTASNGCTDIDEVEVTVDQTPPVVNAGADVTVTCTTPSTILTATGGGTYLWSNAATTASITVIPNITTTYTVTVTASNGCTATDEVIVTADKTAIANAGPDVTVNCTTPSTTLTASGGDTYLWSTTETTAAITVTPLITTTYTVTVTASNGCTDSDEVIVTSDKTAPTANAGADVTVSCSMPNAVLIATGGGNYLWSNGAATASITVSPTVATTYTVTVTSTNGCTDTDEVIVYSGCLDVALTKILSSPLTPVKIGDEVTFTITVYNQGANPIDSIVVADYVPSGYNYNPIDNPTWTGMMPTLLHTATIGNGLLTAPGILPSGSYSFDIKLILNGTAVANNINNFAEVAGVRDTEGNINNDSDSTPDTNPNNDAGGLIGSPADNYILGDGTGTPGSGVASTDEDDHDGATVRIVDMALRKTISPFTPPPYTYGSDVDFVITVFNQGTEPLQNILINDYLASGFEFTPNNGWTEVSPGLLQNTITGPLAVGANTSVTLTLKLKQSAGVGAWTNYAEIGDFEDLGGNSVGQYDFDSTPDNNPNNDAGGQPNSPADDYVNGNGTGTPGDGVDTTDEDDHDGAFVEIFDLALRKILTTAGPYSFGQTLTFSIEVFNQGNVPATNIVVYDYVPNGYTFSANNGWTGAPPTLQNIIPGPLNPGSSTTLTLDLVLQNSPTGMYINYAEIGSANGPSGPGFDADSAPGSNTTGENGVGLGDPEDDDIDVGPGGAAQDDHDPAGPSIFDLALRKEVVTATPSYSYGQNVMYRIVLINQGSVPATNISVIDHFPCGFEFDATSPMNVGWTQTGNTVSQTYTLTLLPGRTDTLYVDMIVRPCYVDQNNAWTNYAEISGAIDVSTGLPGEDIDSTPDEDPTNDNGGVPDFNGDISGTDNTIANENGDEDDHDPHKIQVFDLALRKTLATAGPYTYGQTLTFEIEIFNQGNVTAQNIVISDYIPSGYTFAPNNGWTGGPSVATLTIPGPLAVGDSTTVSLQLTLIASPTGGTAWNNYAEVSASMDDKGNNRNDDADSIADTNPNNDNPVLPGDPDDDNIYGLGPNANEDHDDHDVAAPVVVDLALRKSIVSSGPYTYGVPVTFRVTVFNQGNVAVQNVTVSDYLSAGFTFSANNGWTQTSPTLLSNTIAGPLAPGASTFVDLVLTPIASAAPNAWLNISEIAEFEDLDGNPIGSDDIDSTPDTDPTNDGGGNPDTPSDDAINGDGTGMPGDTSGATDEDDHDPALLPIHDVALVKSGPVGTYDVGDLVTFTITVVNQGNHALDSISIIDYIPAGYSFVPNNNWVASGSNATLTATVSNGLLPAGGILPQIGVNFIIQLTVAPYANIANLVNVAEVTGSRDLAGLDQNADADSTADTDPNNDAGGAVNTSSDNVVNGNGTGVPGDSNPLTDEDDHDPATIQLNYYSLGNQVWLDANNNGIKDISEVGISGVTVQLYYDNPITMALELVGTTLTGANGLYLFDSLANGNYVVVLPASNFATGQPFANYVSSTGSGANNLTSGVYEDPSNQINANNDTDNDDNGVKDGLAAFPGAIVSSVVTLGDGEPTGENPDNDPTTLDTNENLTIDFGLVPMHSIGNQVWVDINNNGIIDGGEAPIANVEVVLHYVDPVSGTCVVIGTVYTDVNGFYLFDSLIAGDYIVEIPASNFGVGQALQGFASSTGNGALYGTDSAADPDNNVDGDDNGVLNGNPMFVGSVVSDTLTLGNNEPLNENPNNDNSGALDGNSNLTVDFGFVPMMSIGNQVWNDANNNGIIDLGEAPIAGVTVVLHYINPNTGLCEVLYTTTTDGNGYYLFSNLIQGSYIVELPGSNFAPGGPLAGTTSSTGSGQASLVSGIYENPASQIDPDNNVDGDDNGVFNGNPMFPGSVVSDTLTLVWNNEPLGETPNNDNSIATDNNSNLTVDFGFTTLHSIGNQVWIDSNYNGIKDGTESGIAGVTVELHYYNPLSGLCELITTTTTGANGLYLFDSLLAGKYIVVIPSSQMLPGGPLQNYLSSTGTFNAGGIYENPGVSADTDIDNDDNGTFNTNPMFFFGVVSDTITLGISEPLSETPNNDTSGAADSNSNLTVDFGFVPKVFDLALTKTQVSPTKVTAYGQVVEFDITVYNQGNLDAANVVITDYIPDGFTLHPSSIGWTMSGSNAEYTITNVIPANTSTIVKIFLEVRMSNQVGAFVNFAEISQAMDTLGNSSNPLVSSPYGTLVDIDSTPDNINGNDAGGQPNGPSDNATTGNGSGPIGAGPASGDEDDHDPALVEIVDIAMRKTVVTPGPYVYGQAVTYRITVFNQGNIGLYNVKVNDYIPAGMVFTPGGANTGWTLSGSTATYTIAGPIAEQSSVDVFITLVPQAIVPGNNATATSWLNRAEISSFEDQDGNDITGDDVDSDGDDNPNNDPTIDDEIAGDPNDPTNPNDEDDHDEEFIEVFDLALRKTLVTPAPYEYGDVMTFNIEVFNQGNVPATNIVVRDYLPIGYTFVANNGWSGASPTIQNTIVGPILPGGSASLTLELTLVQTNGGLRDWINYAEVASGNGPNGPGYDADSTPGSNNADENSTVPGGPGDDSVDSTGDGSVGSQDDHDPAGPSIFDLALRKEVVTATPSYSYGQTVMYRITVFNQGNAPASNIVISDYLPCGLTFNAALPANAGWTLGGSTLTRTHVGTLMPGQSVEYFVDLTVAPCYTDVSNAWTNYAEISSATDNTTGLPGEDIDSTPDNINGNDGGGVPNFEGDVSGTDDTIGNENGDEDDHDGHKIQVFDLALRKVVDDRGPYMIGETATFRITVFNQGNVPATNVLINDYIRSGYTFPANPGWNMVFAPTPAANGLLTYLITSVIMPGASIEIPLNLVVALDANPAVTDWYNYAEIGSAQDTNANFRNDDADSTPNSNTPYENQVLPDGPWDNVIDGNGPNFSQDEDDHDPEMVIVVGGLGDRVWKDTNGNGIQNVGEPGVGGVIATLTDCNGNILQTTVTDNTGFYFFNNLVPGNYQVQFDISGLAPGCDFTYQDVGSNDRIDSDVNRQGFGPCVYITGGQFDSTYDAGLLILAAIGDYVWHDLNGNGQQNSGEPGIPGVEVNLYTADSTYVATTYTDGNGRYLFDFLYPGDYFLLFVAPEGYEHTFANRGSDLSDSDLDNTNGIGTTATTTLSPGERDMTWDAGFYKCVPIGDLVWYDINRNDIWDTNENGINGLRVNLYRNHFGTWGLWEHTFTGVKPNSPSDDGYWKFCAPPGQYYIEVIMPPLGLVRARANVGSNREIDSDLTNSNGPSTSANFTVISGDEKCDLGAGFYPQAQAGNLVWFDENLDGIQDDFEARAEGVKVEAIDLSTGQVARTAYTDMDGVYNLDYLEKQDYYLRFTPPSGYGATMPRATTDDMDSDVDHSFGANTTRSFEMNSGEVNHNIDMGLAYGVLPVDWLDVNARRVNDIHEIAWSTAREANVSHYEVERRLDSETLFSAIPGNVKANGNSSQISRYSLNDLDVSKPGVYVYRVKQVDFDGQYTYSRLVKVSHNGSTALDLYPNPAKNATSVQVVLSDDADVSIELYDVSSKLIKVVTKSHRQQAGDELYSIDLEDVVPGDRKSVV